VHRLDTFSPYRAEIVDAAWEENVEMWGTNEGGVWRGGVFFSP